MNSTDDKLLKLIAAGDKVALGELFSKHLPKLKSYVSKRIDPRISARVDESDVLQEVHVEVIRRIHEYLDKSNVAVYEWMRFLTKQKLAEVTRRHIGVQARDVRRERPLKRPASDDSSILLTSYYSDNLPSPSAVVGKSEVKHRVREAVDKLAPSDREILVLRHVEQLTTSEIAERLQITQNTCRQRHLRALKKLRELFVEAELSWGDLK